MKQFLVLVALLFSAHIGRSQAQTKSEILGYAGVNGGVVLSGLNNWNSAILMHPNAIVGVSMIKHKNRIFREVALEINQYAANVPVGFKVNYKDASGVFFMKSVNAKLSYGYGFHLNKNEAKRSSLYMNAGLHVFLYGKEEGYVAYAAHIRIPAPAGGYIDLYEPVTTYKSDYDHKAFSPVFPSITFGYLLEKVVNEKKAYVRLSTTLMTSPYDLGVSHNLRCMSFQATVGLPLGSITKKK